MNTHTLVQKMMDIEEKLINENGEFTLFALFLRENAPGMWDVMVSAAWIDKNKQAGLKKVCDALTQNLNQSELLMLSRVVIVEHDHPDLAELNRFNFATSLTLIEAKNENLLGQDIKQAFFIPLKQAA